MLNALTLVTADQGYPDVARSFDVIVETRSPRCVRPSLAASHPLSQVYKGGPMLFDFSEPERNTARRALEIYLSDLREEIVKTEKHEWRQALHEEKEILEGVVEKLSI